MTPDSLDVQPIAPLRLPMVRVLVAWCCGITLGWWLGGLWVWVAIGVPALAAAMVAWRAGRSGVVTTPLVCTAIIAAGAAWWCVRDAWLPADDLSRQVSADSKLVDVEGVIEGEAYHRIEPRGAMARFMFSPPSTSFILRVDRWYGDGRSEPVQGKVLVHLPRFDDRMRPGDRIRAQGWLRAMDRRLNPGEYDFARAMARQGVCGQLHLKARGNWQLIAPVDVNASPWTAWHLRLNQRVQHALRQDMSDLIDPQAMALLDAILLGRRTADLGDLGDAFRKTGLAHLLSISGLHVGILAAGVWFFVALVTGRPRWPAIAALVVIGLYLLVVPWRVPLIRASFMTAVFCWAMATGRRASGISAMSAVGVLLLIWRPGDLFAPGFQLSFGIVAALMLFTNPVARWLGGESAFDSASARARPIRKFLAGYFAVSIVAFLTALPLVAYHFHMVSPLAVAMSLAMLPIVAALLWLGFAKIVLSLAVPAIGGWVGLPLGWLAERCAGLVTGGAQLPGAWIAVPTPSPAWAIVTTIVIAALLGGRFARRQIALVACLTLCGVWLMWPSIETHMHVPGRPALRLNMIALGDGSCYVLRSGGEVMMFDCGTTSYADAGRRTIVPALQALGVRHVDVLFLSHPDLDHFCASPEVVDAMQVRRVVTTRQLLEEAGLKPWGATAQLVRHLQRHRGVDVQAVSRGWSATMGEAQVEAIWPNEDRYFEANNDSSLMLMVSAADRRILLCGDAQNEALGDLLASPLALHADVLELPHHGSFIDLSPQWVQRVAPQAVLQSSGPQRLRWDKWPGHLAGARRYITKRDGMVDLSIYHDGRMVWRTFAGKPQKTSDSATGSAIE